MLARIAASQRPGDILAAEHRLLVGEDAQHLLRPACDQVRVSSGGLGVEGDPIDPWFAAPLHLARMHPDMLGRSEFDAAIEVRAPVDRHSMTGLREMLVGPFLPDRPQRHDLAPRRRGDVENPGLGPEPVGSHGPGGGQDVGVPVALVALTAGRVNGDIGRYAVAGTELLGEVAHEAGALLRRQLVRQGDLVLARHLGVLAPLGRLDGVPQRGAVLRPGRSGRRHDEAGRDPGAALVVVDHPGAFVGDETAGAVGRGRGGAASSGAGDGLDAEVVDRHVRCVPRPLPQC